MLLVSRYVRRLKVKLAGRDVAAVRMSTSDSPAEIKLLFYFYFFNVSV